MKMKKIILGLAFTTTALVFSLGGAYAASNIEQINAYLNHDIKFTLNGKDWQPTDKDGQPLNAIIYNGSSYVPLKSVASAVYASVDWNNDTKTISINTKTSTQDTSGIPFKDGQDYNKTGDTSTPSGFQDDPKDDTLNNLTTDGSDGVSKSPIVKSLPPQHQEGHTGDHGNLVVKGSDGNDYNPSLSSGQQALLDLPSVVNNNAVRFSKDTLGGYTSSQDYNEQVKASFTVKGYNSLHLDVDVTGDNYVEFKITDESGNILKTVKVDPTVNNSPSIDLDITGHSKVNIYVRSVRGSYTEFHIKPSSYVTN
jgi:hypothetical protein